MTQYVKDLWTAVQSGERYVGNDVDEDTTYYISPVFLTSNVGTVTIIDSKGNNTIQIADSLTISSSQVSDTGDEIILTLSNGTVIDIRGADTFTFDVTDTAGVTGTLYEFDEFTTQYLGIGGVATVSVDMGLIDSYQSLSASGRSCIFTDNADVANFVVINNFTDNDLIHVSNASDGDYSFSNDGEDVDIIYNNGGTVNMITLTGVVSADDLVYDESSFETAIGFDAFQFA